MRIAVPGWFEIAIIRRGEYNIGEGSCRHMVIRKGDYDHLYLPVRGQGSDMFGVLSRHWNGEGTDVTRTHATWAGAHWEVEIATDGSDCDGRLQTWTLLKATPTHRGLRVRWAQEESDQQDEFAMAAGY